MIFQLIFVRHAESCANVWQKKYLGSQMMYQDPGITVRGITRSQVMMGILDEFIQATFGNGKFTVAASSMIRAQQTAHAMFPESPIHVFPHVAEEGVTYDNIPFSKEKQHEIMGPIVTGRLLEGKDNRDTDLKKKSSLDEFLKWARNHLDLFVKDVSPYHEIYRAVIFTHSNFLKRSFPLPDGSKMMNNGFVFSEFSDDGEQKGKYEYPCFMYHNDPSYVPDPLQKCPDNCRMTVCPKNRGGSRRRKTFKNKRVN